ncbi:MULTISPECIES: phosphatidate cytidylyltransferase [Pseudoxanthomonas]|jgi:phosphatidate cytidylyltransferase|uniref:Phosphatidate cytidylyltransferase n=1 Tax=Pseudoxanthomonas mexicana TaxID=128785 RepID=A0A7G9TBS6_PSEMX|nr:MULTISPECIES: phosphatidate cytidylyltransferase [Pseudoxanthomonas]KAF1727186.1 phosphatidate cytidylyltransferase [Pseudoxanthomonas mexicana]MCH2090361.1 phosphatidate cytidylyltransferase [Pseudoxanthomonas sp.]MCP1583455.1 phosphatidate cytidylyltransferase [Pseudoxanthomonas mexicana]QLQ28624.1 MAG: phosphatidate cytidylyltransferase [Pseudoxanthomonas sp.]QND81634.1 phosphatidate cytidylyltransferase [Pseudoxanthomonas mexicana]
MSATRTRVIAALVMAPFAIGAILLLPTSWLVMLAALVFLVGLWEWFKLAEIDDTLQRTVLLTANLLLMVLLVWASRGSTDLVPLRLMALVGAGWWLLALLWLRFFHFASDHETWARVFKLAAGTLAVVPAWCALGLIHSSQPNGHIWLFVALAIVWAADSGAYFAGRHFGGRWFAGRKLAPRISPNKTLEGLLGGLAAGMLVAAVGALLAGAGMAQLPGVLLVAIFTVLFSVVGDLFESLLKRHVGAKDSGDVIPGHGGVLDRIDGVLAALPIFVLGKEVFGF